MISILKEISGALQDGAPKQKPSNHKSITPFQMQKYKKKNENPYSYFNNIINKSILTSNYLHLTYET